MKFSLNSTFRKLIFCGFIFMSLVFFSNLDQELQADTAKKIKVRPDISFHKVTFKRNSVTPLKDHRVTIKVSIKNFSVVRTCTGPFKIRVEWRNNKKRPYILLQESGVTNLCYDPIKKRLSLASRNFEHIVRSGKTNYYRIKIDPLSQVSESNENNNVIFKEYKAGPVISLPINNQAQLSIEDRLPSCDGIDLIIKGVEIIRGSSGNVFIKATIKNLCTGSCRGPIIIEVDESEVPGHTGGIEQQIGSGIGSKEEFTMGSALGIVHDPSRSCSYIISVRTEGGCTEPPARTGNNTFRIVVDPI